jgi:hypothetical protein
MRKFLLIQDKMAPGKFSPGSIFLDFGVSQTVVVGCDLRFESGPLLFQFLFVEQFVQNRRLRVGTPSTGLLVKVSQVVWGKGECSALFAG